MLETTKIKNVPEPTVKRLSYYIIYLHHLLEEGYKNVSSTKIAEELSFDPTQVRKDLQFTGVMGQPKIGFDIEDSINAIKDCLHWQVNENAFLIGVGNLGKAIMGYGGMNDFGIKFVAAFDSDESKIGDRINDVEVLHIDRLVVLSKLMKVKLAVIAVPEKQAQKVTNLLVEGGITAIWNLQPCRLKVPEGVIVEDAHIIQSLAVLTNKLSLIKKYL